MTPQQEARLLRARAATLRAEATLFETIVLSELNGALIQTRIVEAVENETIAAELEAQAMLKPAERAWCAACGRTRVEHETPRAPGACRAFTGVMTP